MLQCVQPHRRKRQIRKLRCERGCFHGIVGTVDGDSPPHIGSAMRSGPREAKPPERDALAGRTRSSRTENHARAPWKARYDHGFRRMICRCEATAGLGGTSPWNCRVRYAGVVGCGSRMLGSPGLWFMNSSVRAWWFYDSSCMRVMRTPYSKECRSKTTGTSDKRGSATTSSRRLWTCL